MPLFTSSGLGLVILVLVFRIWSCLHHCNGRVEPSSTSIMDNMKSQRVDAGKEWSKKNFIIISNCKDQETVLN